jgi:hypothetical protein
MVMTTTTVVCGEWMKVRVLIFRYVHLMDESLNVLMTNGEVEKSYTRGKIKE